MVLSENETARVATLDDADTVAIRRAVAGEEWRRSIRMGVENGWHALAPERVVDELANWGKGRFSY